MLDDDDPSEASEDVCVGWGGLTWGGVRGLQPALESRWKINGAPPETMAAQHADAMRRALQPSMLDELYN